MIHPSSIIHPGVRLGRGSTVGAFCELGSEDGTPLVIGERSTIRSYTRIEGGSEYGPELETGHHVLLRSANAAGENLRIGSYSSLEGGAEIGDFVRIHGRCEATQVRIEHFARVYGGTYLTDNRLPPSHLKDPATLREGCVLCMGILLIAGVEIGVGAFVAGGLTVSRSVPDGVAQLRGRQVPVTELVYDGVRHPWTGHYADTYPVRAHERIAVLHERILAAVGGLAHA